MATTTRASLMHNGAGCDNCPWTPPYKAGTLAQVKVAARRHARRYAHATFVLVEQCTNYDERARAATHYATEPRTAPEPSPHDPPNQTTVHPDGTPTSQPYPLVPDQPKTLGEAVEAGIVSPEVDFPVDWPGSMSWVEAAARMRTGTGNVTPRVKDPAPGYDFVKRPRKGKEAAS